ncbi:MAG: hypothetical protein JWQ25_470 [Daejeonella sp.]|nr:hypothetical protein [Daejeonella sp.]
MILENLEYVYVRVQGLIWIINGLVESTNVRVGVGNELDRIYNTSSTTLPLIADFKNIESISDHTLDGLMKSISVLTRPIIFINTNTVEATLVPDLPVDIGSHRFYDKSTRSLNISLIGNFSTIDFSDLVSEITKKKVQGIVKSSFSTFGTKKHLASTPILANGIYDANNIISNYDSFYWVCLVLNDLLKDTLSQKNNIKYPIRLLSVSLRSAPFASVLAQLNKIPLKTIDHLGPRHKVFDLDILPNLLDKKKFSYVYIGDFCFGGTEIKIAKTYAQFAQSIFEKAIVIGSLLPSETFKDDFDLHTILDLRELGSEAGAEFKLVETKKI